MVGGGGGGSGGGGGGGGGGLAGRSGGNRTAGAIPGNESPFSLPTCYGGAGGTQTAGGAGGEPCFQNGGAGGRLGDGGRGGWGYLFFLFLCQSCTAPAGFSGPTGDGGGGGGGLFGGEGGGGGGFAGAGGGGGGSGFGPPDATYRMGVRRGNGFVTVTYRPNCSGGGACVRSVPGAPTAVHAAPGDREATVAFAAPSTESPILSYTVTASPGGAYAAGDRSPNTVHGLTDGKSDTFKVTATDALGTGPRSKATDRVTPAPLPGAPTNVIAIGGHDGAAIVGFTTPVSRWSPIASYTVTASPGGERATATKSPVMFDDLTDGTAYTFTVTATNEIGTGPRSTPSNAVTPSGVPGAPTGAVALGGRGLATVAFDAPASNGSPITSYTVTASPDGVTATGKHSPIVISGLTKGTSYTFTVTATNAVGTGPPSTASNAVIPVAPPGAPTGVTATTDGAGGALVSFTAPSSNGAPISSYTATATSSDGGLSATVTAGGSPITIAGLTSASSIPSR